MAAPPSVAAYSSCSLPIREWRGSDLQVVAGARRLLAAMLLMPLLCLDRQVMAGEVTAVGAAGWTCPSVSNSSSRMWRVAVYTQCGENGTCAVQAKRYPDPNPFLKKSFDPEDTIIIMCVYINLILYFFSVFVPQTS